MIIDLTQYQENEIFSIENCDLAFKKVKIVIKGITDVDVSKEILDKEVFIYVYSNPKDGITNWSVDARMANYLAEVAGIKIISQTIVAAYQDACFMRQEKRKENGFWSKEIARFVGRTVAEYRGTTYTFDRQAAIDNVGSMAASYAAEMSMKRSTISAVIKILKIEEFSPDANLPEFIQPNTKEDISEETPFASETKSSDAKMTELQKESLKSLLRKNHKNWGKKFEKLTADEASKMIKELQ
jgi:hypothetical protein